MVLRRWNGAEDRRKIKKGNKGRGTKHREYVIEGNERKVSKERRKREGRKLVALWRRGGQAWKLSLVMMVMMARGVRGEGGGVEAEG